MCALCALGSTEQVAYPLIWVRCSGGRMNQLEALQAVAQLPPPLGCMGEMFWILFLCSLQSVSTHVQIPLFLVGFSCQAKFDLVLSYLGRRGVIPLTGSQSLKCEEVDIYQKLNRPISCKIMGCSLNMQNSFLFLVKIETTLILINKVSSPLVSQLPNR